MSLASPSAAPGWKGNERADLALVAPVVLAARAQRLRLAPGNAADAVQEHEHQQRTGKGQPPACVAEREQQVGEPVDPFEEIVRVARPGPQADAAGKAAVGRILAELRKLVVRERFAAYREHPDGGRGEDLPWCRITHARG